MVTGHAQAIKPQRQWDSPQQIGHEDQAAVENRDYGEFAVAIVGGDLCREFVEPAQDRFLIKKHPLQIGLHTAIVRHFITVTSSEVETSLNFLEMGSEIPRLRSE